MSGHAWSVSFRGVAGPHLKYSSFCPQPIHPKRHIMSIGSASAILAGLTVVINRQTDTRVNSRPYHQYAIAAKNAVACERGRSPLVCGTIIWPRWNLAPKTRRVTYSPWRAKYRRGWKSGLHYAVFQATICHFLTRKGRHIAPITVKFVLVVACSISLHFDRWRSDFRSSVTYLWIHG